MTSYLRYEDLLNKKDRRWIASDLESEKCPHIPELHISHLPGNKNKKGSIREEISPKIGLPKIVKNEKHQGVGPGTTEDLCKVNSPLICIHRIIPASSSPTAKSYYTIHLQPRNYASEVIDGQYLKQHLRSIPLNQLQYWEWICRGIMHLLISTTLPYLPIKIVPRIWRCAWELDNSSTSSF